MTEQKDSRRSLRCLAVLAAIVVIIYGINQARSVLVLFLVSVFLAVLGMPPVFWLIRKRFPSSLAVLTVVAGMIIVLLLVGVVLGTSISSFSAALPLYQTRLQEQILGIKTLLAGKGVELTDKIILDYLNPGRVMGLTAGLLTGLGSAFSNIVLILLTVTFILFEALSFPVKFCAALGDRPAAFQQFSRFGSDIKRYMVIQTGISLTTGIVIAIWLSILGVDFPVLLGLLAFLLHYVPSLGSIISAIPAFILAFIQFGIGRAALAVAGYLAVGFVIGNVIHPRLMGQKLGLSTLVVFLSLIFWGSLLGPIGMVLCVPFTMALKFAFESSDSTRWIAVFLGNDPAREMTPPGAPLEAEKKKKDRKMIDPMEKLHRIK
jgi:AI-2 transport protein TqsA